MRRMAQHAQSRVSFAPVCVAVSVAVCVAVSVVCVAVSVVVFCNVSCSWMGSIGSQLHQAPCLTTTRELLSLCLCACVCASMGNIV